MRETRIAGLLAMEAGTPKPVLDGKLNQIVGSLPEGELIHLTGVSGVRLFPAQQAAGMPPLPEMTCDRTVLQEAAVGSEQFRQLCRPVQYMGQAAYLNISGSLAEDQALLHMFTVSLLRSIPLLLLASGIGGHMISRRALRPIDRLIAEAQKITVIDLGRRLTVSSADDQLRRLAMEWNNLLERLQVALDRVSQFTADASHELRNPIAFIQATAEYSASTPGIDPESRDAFLTIVQETQSTTAMLETLLILARPDEPEIPGSDLVTALHSAVEQAIAYVRPVAARKQQRLFFHCGHEASPILSVDPLHLRRVLLALIENAVKYTPAGGIVTVSYVVNGDLSVCVRDTGIGIAAADIDRIFDRFYRVDKVRSESSEGVGLGLSLAKMMVELYGGGITVESEPGAGSIFKVTLPRRLLLSASSFALSA